MPQGKSKKKLQAPIGATFGGALSQELRDKIEEERRRAKKRIGSSGRNTIGKAKAGDSFGFPKPRTTSKPRVSPLRKR